LDLTCSRYSVLTGFFEHGIEYSVVYIRFGYRVLSGDEGRMTLAYFKMCSMRGCSYVPKLLTANSYFYAQERRYLASAVLGSHVPAATAQDLVATVNWHQGLVHICFTGSWVI